jgi:hypothetical protein
MAGSVAGHGDVFVFRSKSEALDKPEMPKAGCPAFAILPEPDLCGPSIRWVGCIYLIRAFVTQFLGRLTDSQRMKMPAAAALVTAPVLRP